MQDKIASLERWFGVKFNNQRRVIEVLTHASYFEDLPKAQRPKEIPRNGHLAHIGDAAIYLAVTEHIAKRYGNEDLGFRTSVRHQMVSNQLFSDIVLQTKIGSYIRVGKRIKKLEEIGKNFMASSLEALIGCAFMEQGYDAARKAALQILVPYEKRIVRVVRGEAVIIPISVS